MFFFYHSFPLLSWIRLGIVLESFRNCLRLNVELSLNIPEIIWESSWNHIRIILESSWNYLGILLESKDATMVGFWEKSQKSDQMPYFGQNLVGFLSLQRNLEEFSRNSEIYQHDNV